MSEQPPPTDPSREPQPPAPEPPAPPQPAAPQPPAPAPAPPPAQPPYGQAPAGYGPPAQNPYGGATADPWAAQRSMQPGHLGYVEAHFGPVASFGDRVLALLVDGLLSLVALGPMLIGIPFIVAGAPDSTGYDDYGYQTYGDANGGLIAVGVSLVVLGFLVGLGVQLWNRVFRMGRTGQSVGKKAMGLRLLDARTGQPIGAGMCFLRELVSGLVNQVIYLSYLWMLWDDDKQTIADKAVHSTVVKVPKA
ncbi:RDD family protein [Phycicoccus sonneratiae]|uniref:RDD family protein n=1 Tax=Phycicoccus sonneratiae TaxID=2807628 RepID=A0ABS2CQS6_9MICO|nr:RDD family protein [Phycicoccus sonneraticus]MBM6401486.1 RDD family protein [Phycicoccus sonneraticus]